MRGHVPWLTKRMVLTKLRAVTQDTNVVALYYALGLIRNARAHRGCEAKIRGAASALAFCLAHSLDFAEAMGWTTGAPGRGRGLPSSSVIGCHP